MPVVLGRVERHVERLDLAGGREAGRERRKVDLALRAAQRALDGDHRQPVVSPRVSAGGGGGAHAASGDPVPDGWSALTATVNTNVSRILPLDGVTVTDVIVVQLVELPSERRAPRLSDDRRRDACAARTTCCAGT